MKRILRSFVLTVLFVVFFGLFALGTAYADPLKVTVTVYPKNTGSISGKLEYSSGDPVFDPAANTGSYNDGDEEELTPVPADGY